MVKRKKEVCQSFFKLRQTPVFCIKLFIFSFLSVHSCKLTVIKLTVEAALL